MSGKSSRYECSPKKGSAFTLTAAARVVRRLVALLPPREFCPKTNGFQRDGDACALGTHHP